MKEKLVKYWERKERQMEQCPEGGVTFFGQAFGALEFAKEMLNDWNKEAELNDLWNNAWKLRLEEKLYGKMR